MTANSSTQPRIVIPDGFTLNPGDLDWSGLRALGERTVHDRSPLPEVVARAGGAAFVPTNRTIVDAAVNEARSPNS